MRLKFWHHAACPALPRKPPILGGGLKDAGLLYLGKSFWLGWHPCTAHERPDRVEIRANVQSGRTRRGKPQAEPLSQIQPRRFCAAFFSKAP